MIIQRHFNDTARLAADAKILAFGSYHIKYKVSASMSILGTGECMRGRWESAYGMHTH